MTSSYFSVSYKEHGERAALLAMVPGLGHLRSGQYVTGILTVSAISGLLMWVYWLGILQFGSSHANLSTARAYFIIWTSALWAASVFHAYYSVIKKRKRDAVRESIDLAVDLFGHEATGSQFRLSGRTKNLSRSGACLVVSRELPIHTKLTIAFGRKTRRRARVIWSRATANGDETRIGVEFTRPLAAHL